MKLKFLTSIAGITMSKNANNAGLNCLLWRVSLFIGTLVATSVSLPSIASAADLYFSDFSNGTIGKIDLAGNVSTFASGFNSPRGIAFDASGNLYVSEQGTVGNNSIKKITPSKNISTFVSGLNSPVFGLAFDPAFRR